MSRNHGQGELVGLGDDERTLFDELRHNRQGRQVRLE
jgi:hypothetical protein